MKINEILFKHLYSLTFTVELSLNYHFKHIRLNYNLKILIAEFKIYPSLKS